MTLLAAASDFLPTNVENSISGFVIGIIAVLLGCLVAALVAKVAGQATGWDGDVGSDLMSFVSDVKNFRVNLLIILSLLGVFGLSWASSPRKVIPRRSTPQNSSLAQSFLCSARGSAPALAQIKLS